MPKVFISYSWDDEEHKKWTRSFADKLLESGIDTYNRHLHFWVSHTTVPEAGTESSE